MESEIYQVYQGENLGFTLEGRGDGGVVVEIASDIVLIVDLVRDSNPTIALSSLDGDIVVSRPDKVSFEVVVPPKSTASLVGGDYTIVLSLVQGERQIIEQLHILRIIESVHGRLLCTDLSD